MKRGGVVPVTFSFKANLASISKKEEKRSGKLKFVVVLMFVQKPPTLPYLYCIIIAILLYTAKTMYWQNNTYIPPMVVE